MNASIKKNWKTAATTLAVTGALVTAFALSASAYNRYGGMMGGYDHPMMGSAYTIDRISHALDLTAEQRSKLQAMETYANGPSGRGTGGYYCFGPGVRD